MAFLKRVLVSRLPPGPEFLTFVAAGNTLESAYL